MLLISGAVNQKAALNGGAWVLEASEGLPPFVQKDSLWGLLPLFIELWNEIIWVKPWLGLEQVT